VLGREGHERQDVVTPPPPEGAVSRHSACYFLKGSRSTIASRRTSYLRGQRSTAELHVGLHLAA